jgi:hypothetical protein
MGPSFCLALLCFSKKFGVPLLHCSLVLLFPLLLICFVTPFFVAPFFITPLLCYSLFQCSLFHYAFTLLHPCIVAPCFTTPLFCYSLVSLCPCFIAPYGKDEIGADVNFWMKILAWMELCSWIKFMTNIWKFNDAMKLITQMHLEWLIRWNLTRWVNSWCKLNLDEIMSMNELKHEVSKINHWGLNWGICEFNENQWHGWNNHISLIGHTKVDVHKNYLSPYAWMPFALLITSIELHFLQYSSFIYIASMWIILYMNKNLAHVNNSHPCVMLC